jgi:transcriptional regulator with XRE-family HTH domain
VPRSATALAALVRARRERLHLTQVELAKRVGVSRSEISEIEAGRVKHPRAGVFARLGKVLGVPGAALLAAVGYVASEAAGMPGAVELEEAEELLVLGSLFAQMTEAERRWLRERLRELQQLVLLRKRGTPRTPPATRPPRRRGAT